jgi:hypothetical protein
MSFILDEKQKKNANKRIFVLKSNLLSSKEHSVHTQKLTLSIDLSGNPFLFPINPTLFPSPLSTCFTHPPPLYLLLPPPHPRNSFSSLCTQSRLNILTYGTTMNETKYKNVHLHSGGFLLKN